jgi:hypothetical protein
LRTVACGLGSAVSTAVTGLGSITHLNAGRVVTADKANSGGLEVISWGIDSLGNVTAEGTAIDSSCYPYSFDSAPAPAIGRYFIAPNARVITVRTHGRRRNW